MPDAEDRRNIAELIKTYDKAFTYPHPLSIGVSMELALKEIDNRATTKTIHTSSGSSRVVKENAGMTRRMSLPKPFMEKLKQAYPLIITDKGQYEWFLRNFPHLDLAMYDGGVFVGVK